MSTDIQTPDLSLNVRYSTADKKNGAEKEEIQVAIYDNEDTLKHGQTDLGPHKVRPRTQNNLSAVRGRHFSTASVLGVMYLLILAGIFTRYILATLDKQNLVTERDLLSISLNQARATVINLTEEVHELQSRNDILSKNNRQSEDELKELNVDLKGCRNRRFSDPSLHGMGTNCHFFPPYG